MNRYKLHKLIFFLKTTREDFIQDYQITDIEYDIMFYKFYNNMISNNASKENIKQILVFRNKLLISTTYDLNMVMCKNESDCIRLYNELEREIEKNKIKYVYFTGDAYHSYLKKTWFKKIQNLTGWDETKIRRRNLRP